MSSTCLQIKTNPVIQQQHQQQHYIVASSEGSSPLKHHLNQSTSPKHYQLIPHPNYRAILNCRGATTESGHELTTNATTYFPITLPANHFACNPANNYNQSPTIKYHGMQLQTPLSHVKGFNPQDPHLHTATVHGKLYVFSLLPFSAHKLESLLGELSGTSVTRICVNLISLGLCSIGLNYHIKGKVTITLDFI